MTLIQYVTTNIIENIRESQRNKKRKLNIDHLEQTVISNMGSDDKYRKHGGYGVFFHAVERLIEANILQRMKNSVGNGKKPPLDKHMWIAPKYTQNQWTLEQITAVSDRIDLSVYKVNKKLQTEDEWRRIQIVYQFLKQRERAHDVIREQRSFMLFHGERWLEDMEAEKWLSSPNGHEFLRRTKLTPNDLRFYDVREPFIYWRYERAPAMHENEVLIVENLSAYHTCKQMLQQQINWCFGPIPSLLIWGAGNRIETTIDYLQDVVSNPSTLTIRYAGDIDYEGIAIFFRLQEKNKQLTFVFAESMYEFMVQNCIEHRTVIMKEQRRVDSYLSKLQQAFQDKPHLYEVIQQLWLSRERIAQEVLNIDMLVQKGWLTLD